jgi:hypothetical protein
MTLTLKTETLEPRATEQLQAAKKLRSRYNSADKSQAIEAAAKTAASFSKDAFVIASNRYGQAYWFVTTAKLETTSRITNSGRIAYRVTQSREIYRMEYTA